MEEGRVEEPVVEAMEAIGGTGDTLMGMAAALMTSGMETLAAALVTARANRLMGFMAGATPATSVGELVAALPKALGAALARR